MRDTDEQFGAAVRALEGLEAPARAVSDTLSQVFETAAESLAVSLARAARDGEISLSELMRAVLAAGQAASGIGAGSAQNGPFSGETQGGGPGFGASPVSMILNLPAGGGESLVRSEAQIAQALMRAVQVGRWGS
ncbi:MAG: phage tail tape measure protein [Asticcacaulis sp.]